MSDIHFGTGKMPPENITPLSIADWLCLAAAIAETEARHAIRKPLTRTTSRDFLMQVFCSVAAQSPNRQDRAPRSPQSRKISHIHRQTEMGSSGDSMANQLTRRYPSRALSY
ncbi:hypothetical protein [Mesorhizobium sp. M7A.F.Ca.MR.362.00.0.0]|uniref:hypothetical protein n=1 Tax=Mesorhizobium sp. M7A.F.Ca.MR.362.00.0.0 TaxID=2496779 RepID=UPI000FD4CA00|nr:hypothetical protein [Mesorhizobium sp. M7A.F.Ca.MR.362.00.0.0]RUU79366.1 hypothetical protein EOC06_16385 [Mesorhizobium sp. M7A.F.Ca.MR.362.00.0.0]RWN91915.1 MAG: hypothetical protein EOS05_19475 [Mesorhizobium sp.]